MRTMAGGLGKGYCVSLAFDVGFVVDDGAQRVTTNHTNHCFEGRRTVPDDMGHDGTLL